MTLSDIRESHEQGKCLDYQKQRYYIIKIYVIYSWKNVDLYVCPASFITSPVSDQLIL